MKNKIIIGCICLLSLFGSFILGTKVPNTASQQIASEAYAKDAVGPNFEIVDSFPIEKGLTSPFCTLYVFCDNETGIDYFVTVSTSGNGTRFASTPVPRMTNINVAGLHQYYTER